jgi:hypothetical protein
MIAVNKFQPKVQLETDATAYKHKHLNLQNCSSKKISFFYSHFYKAELFRKGNKIIKNLT